MAIIIIDINININIISFKYIEYVSVRIVEQNSLMGKVGSGRVVGLFDNKSVLHAFCIGRRAIINHFNDWFDSMIRQLRIVIIRTEQNRTERDVM